MYICVRCMHLSTVAKRALGPLQKPRIFNFWDLSPALGIIIITIIIIKL